VLKPEYSSLDRDVPSVLVVIGGLPATGKSTLATALARRTSTPYLRVDRIEQAIIAWSALSHPVGPVGYAVAHTLAREQLELGLDVIVECVNPTAYPGRLGRNGCGSWRTGSRDEGDLLRRR
jgi:hypothetical protein